MTIASVCYDIVTYKGIIPMRIFLPIFVLLLAVAFCRSSLAVSISNNAHIEIVDPAQLKGNTDFNIFTINKKDVSGATEISIGSDGSVRKQIIGGVSEVIARGDGEFSEGFDIVVSQDSSVQIDVKDKTKKAGVSLVNFVAKYNDKPISFPYMNQSNTSRKNNLKLGATVKLDDKTKPGSYSPAFEIALYYE